MNEVPLNISIPLPEGEDQTFACSRRSTRQVSMNDEQVYKYIFSFAQKAKVYGALCHDVAAEAWLLALERGYFDPRSLSEAARNLGIWKIVQEDDVYEDIADGRWDVEIRIKKQRERIEDAIASASEQVQKACRLVLDEGFDLGEAARAVGLSSTTFSRALACLGRRKK